MSILEEAINKFKRIVESNGLADSRINVKMRPLKPEEAIGKPTRDDYPLLKGKEVLIEAAFLEAKGQAFTDEPSDFEGTINDVITLPLTNNRNRAIAVATINAILRYLKKADGTIHCKDREPEECAQEMADRLYQRWGEHLTVGIVGLQPAIASAMIKRFSSGNVQISDLDSDNIGREFEGVTILDGSRYSRKVVANNFLTLATGSTIVNGTIDAILEENRKNNKSRIVIFFGTTIAGVDVLMNLRRLCFKSH